MVKGYEKCHICNSRKFLNFAGLCKRCNRKPGSSKFVEKALTLQARSNAMKAEEKALEKAAAEAQELIDAEAAAEGEETEEGEEAKE